MILASLENQVNDLRKQKQIIIKERKKIEQQLKNLRSTEKRSSSSLVSVDKKIELERENISEISNILNQKTSQLESIERLISEAEGRILRDKESIEQLEQEIEFSGK